MSASLDIFLASLASDSPPRRLPPALASLWLGLKGRWKDAHQFIEDDDEDPEAALVHAWLLRLAGAREDAIFWYRLADVTPRWGDVDEEGRAIARMIIDGDHHVRCLPCRPARS